MVIKAVKQSDDDKIDSAYIEAMLSKIYTDLNKWMKRIKRRKKNLKRKSSSKKRKKTGRRRPRRKFKRKTQEGGDNIITSPITSNKTGGNSSNNYYSKILNPTTGSFVSITSKVGQTLLNNYLNVLTSYH